MKKYSLLVSIYIGSIKSKRRYCHKKPKRKIDLISQREFKIRDWTLINAYDAKWYLLDAVEFEDDPNSYVIGDFCDFTQDPESGRSKSLGDYYFIDLNPKYISELREILIALKEKSKIGAVIILFRLDPDNRIEGVYSVDNFMEKLINHEILFNVAYLIQ